LLFDKRKNIFVFSYNKWVCVLALNGKIDESEN
jgi:hypothetical protein